MAGWPNGLLGWDKTELGNKGRCQKHPEGEESLVFRGGTDHIHYFQGGTRSFLVFLGAVESNSGIFRGGSKLSQYI